MHRKISIIHAKFIVAAFAGKCSDKIHGIFHVASNNPINFACSQTNYRHTSFCLNHGKSFWKYTS